MATGDGGRMTDTEPEPPDNPSSRTEAAPPQGRSNQRRRANDTEPNVTSGDDEDKDDVDEDDVDEVEDEPMLKYSKLTSHFPAAYRNGDSTSAFLAACGYLILGTHNGNVHVYVASTLQLLRSYRAHSASVNSISASPFSTKPHITRTASSAANTSSPGPAWSASHPSRRIASGSILSNIHVATCSLDGLVCVSSLGNTDDVTVRNFARPVQAIALSPDYKNDRTYLSGGLAGNLIVTVGGRTGVKTDANTNSAAAAASGWLGSLGLGGASGRDTILHSGEGKILAISWSLSGKYVAWVNEEGIKIMRSNLHLDTSDPSAAWTRLGHFDHPNRRGWSGMSGVWQPRLHWVDEECFDSVDSTDQVAEQSYTPSPVKSKDKHVEKLLVGWGDAIWVLGVETLRNEASHTARRQHRPAALSRLQIDDGVVSDLLLYSNKLLIVLVFRTRDDANQAVNKGEKSAKSGIKRHQNALQPDLRVIELGSNTPTLEITGLNVSRYEGLSSSDYHLSSIFIPGSDTSKPASKGTLDAISGLLEVSRNATRLFSSSASVMSGSSSDKGADSTINSPPVQSLNKPILSLFTKPGLKVLIQSPYDCILASKRESVDKLQWLLEREDYAAAWNLVDRDPTVAVLGDLHEDINPRPSSPDPFRNGQTLADFLEDDAASVKLDRSPNFTAAEREKRRIGDKWVQKLVNLGQWAEAGRLVAQVVNTTSSWEQWMWTFIKAQKFDEIAPYVPTSRMRPALPTTVYDIILGHYIQDDPRRAHNLIMAWDESMYDSQSVTAALQSRLSSEQQSSVSEEYMLLQESLATLLLADMKPADAFRAYVRSGKTDKAIDLVEEYQLFDVVAEDVWEFVRMHTISNPSIASSEESVPNTTLKSIELLAKGAVQNLIPVPTVVKQLKEHDSVSRKVLFLYFRTLWTGILAQMDSEGGLATGRIESGYHLHRRRRFDHDASALSMKAASRSLLAPFADQVVDIFADFSHSLLCEVVRASDDVIRLPYDYDHALAVCQKHNFTDEVVYILAATGKTKDALHLIINEIGDVKQAISFAKEIDDPGIWEDLINYSVKQPAFVVGLLEDGLSSNANISPADLVRKIPENMEIPGLKIGLLKLLHENDIQCSIGTGAARVLESEVAAAMLELFHGRAKGLLFDTNCTDARRLCHICQEPWKDEENSKSAYLRHHGYLVARPCGHVMHLECVLDTLSSKEDAAVRSRVEGRLYASSENDLHVQGRSKIQAMARQKTTHATLVGGLMDKVACTACGQDAEIMNDD